MLDSNTIELNDIIIFLGLKAAAQRAVKANRKEKIVASFVTNKSEHAKIQNYFKPLKFS